MCYRPSASRQHTVRWHERFRPLQGTSDEAPAARLAPGCPAAHRPGRCRRFAARGESYVVVGSHVTNDLQAPAFLPGVVCCYLVHFTDREVILARAGHALTLSNVQEGTFATQSGFSLPDGSFYVEKRGWLSVDVEKG